MRKAAALRRLPVRLDRVDLVIAVVDALVVMHFVEDEVLEFRTEIGSVADADAGVATSEGSRELLITKGKSESDDVLVAVRDSGPGLAPAALEISSRPSTRPSPMPWDSGCRSVARS
jgi:hypothetical protein